jgi:hypothetical protein
LFGIFLVLLRALSEMRGDAAVLLGDRRSAIWVLFASALRVVRVATILV